MDPIIKQLQTIVNSHQHGTVGGKDLDVTTAGLILQVYENLSPPNQKKFLSLGISGMIEMTLALLDQKAIKYVSRSTGLKSIEAVQEGKKPADVVQSILESVKGE